MWSFKWLDWIFLRSILPTLSIYYVGIKKNKGKRLPQLYYRKMKTCYDPCFIGIEVASTTLVLVQYNTIPSMLAYSRRWDSPLPPPRLFFLLTSLRVVPAICTPETGYAYVAIACEDGGILVPGVLSWRGSRHAKRRKIPSATFLISFECRPLFVTLVGNIWLPNQEEWCNTKLTCERARPRVTKYDCMLHVRLYFISTWTC